MNRTQLEKRSQAVRSAVPGQSPGHGELGGGLQHLGHDHREREGALSRRPASEQALKAERFRGSAHRHDVPVRIGSLDGHHRVQARNGDSALQYRAKPFDHGQRERRQIRDRLLADALALAPRFSEQDRRLAILSLDDVDTEGHGAPFRMVDSWEHEESYRIKGKARARAGRQGKNADIAANRHIFATE